LIGRSERGEGADVPGLAVETACSSGGAGPGGDAAGGEDRGDQDVDVLVVGKGDQCVRGRLGPEGSSTTTRARRLQTPRGVAEVVDELRVFPRRRWAR